MKRRIRKLCVFLLLGAIINVAVAWALVRLNENLRWTPRVQVDHRWADLKPFPDTSEDSQFGRGIGFGVRKWEGRGKSFGVIVTILQCGWPLKALEGARWLRTKNVGNQAHVAASHHEWSYPMHFGLVLDFVPLCPLWPGFAINTIFYAAILWLLFAFPFVIHRRRRIRRGLCLKCGYDLRGRGSDSQTCPECGTPTAMPDSRKPTAESAR